MLKTYTDFQKYYVVFNRLPDDDLRCQTIQRGKIIKDVSLTLSSFDRLCYLDRLPQFKNHIDFK